ncbi:hypothetical protein D3C85_1393300 [compost metagenome]
MIDRKGASLSSPSGIHGLNDQDRAMQEGMLALPGTEGRIVDREKEFLLPTDIAIVRSRRRLLEYVKSEESLAKFREIVKDGSAYAVVPLDVVSELGEMDEFLERHHGELMRGDTAEPAAA